MWVNGLPTEAATRRIDGQQWTMQEELLAALVERVDSWGLHEAYRSTPKSFHKHLPDKPITVRRPGQGEAGGNNAHRPRRRAEADAGQADAFFANTPKF